MVDRTLIAVVEGGCIDCDRTVAVVEQVHRENAATGLEVERVDVWADARRARRLGVIEHPTLVIVTNGRERARLAGRVTHRQLLRKLLPHLHADRADATEALRVQLHSPAEEFPGRRSRLVARGVNDKVERIRAVDLFAGLSTRQLRAVARLTDEVPVDAGQMIVTEGEPGDTCFVVVEGRCEVRRRGRKLSQIGTGATVGEMALIDEKPRSATVTALTDMELLVIGRADFHTLIDSVEGMALAVIAQMAARLRAADRQIVG